VVICNIQVRDDVACSLGSEAKRGKIKVGSQVLFRFIEITALEVVTGNVDV